MVVTVLNQPTMKIIEFGTPELLIRETFFRDPLADQ